VGAVLHLAIVEVKGSTRPRQSRPTLWSRVAVLALAIAPLAVVTGCGNTYRPVVSAISPVGPASQPIKYAVAVSSPSPSAPGLVTLANFSGDTVMVTAALGVNPYYLAVNAAGNEGYTLNSDGTVNSFAISPTLMTNDVQQTTLLLGANPASLFAEGTYTYIAQPGRNSVAELTGIPPSLQQELPASPGYLPIYTVGVAATPRSYAITQKPGGGIGEVLAIDNTNAANSPPTITNTIPVGNDPIYGVMTTDGRRAFILNQTDGTVSVINAQTNALDTFHDPTDPTNTRITSTIPVGPSPVWADLATTRAELVVANQGNGITPGSVSIISIPLCSQVALPTNQNCDQANPVDAVGFGTVLATVPVGVNPIMVTVLADGTRAYVANAGNPARGIAGSVSVVSLVSNAVTATLTALPDAQCSTATVLAVCGHPVYIASTTGVPTGKVYVVSKDSNFMSVINTDIDQPHAIIPIQGSGVSVRMTAP
jgi:DNA-binding beta-propeller fold protein YncE